MTDDLFNAKIQEMMKYKKFDLIMVEDGYSSKRIAPSILKYYKLSGSILVNLPQDRRFYSITVWRPN